MGLNGESMQQHNLKLYSELRLKMFFLHRKITTSKNKIRRRKKACDVFKKKSYNTTKTDNTSQNEDVDNNFKLLADESKAN